MNALRVVFAGTPEFGVPCLDAIWNSQHQLLAVYTQPDRPAGRGQSTQFSPVKQWAIEHHLPVYQPPHFKEPSTVAELAALKPDVIVVIAYGLLLPASVLTTPVYGCINVHASLLPRWRGASPIQQVILAGDATSGVTIMKMDEGLDTGPAFIQATLPISPNETSASLHDKLALQAIEPLMKTLNSLQDNAIPLTVQDNQRATYAPKIKKEDAHIHWQNDAVVIERQIRAYSPWPVVRTYGHGDMIRVHQAHVVEGDSDALPGTVLRIDKQGMLVATGRDRLCIEQVQFAGGKVMSVADWVNGGRAESCMHVVLE